MAFAPVRFHHGLARALVHATEDPGRVRAALRFVLPGLEPQERKLEGHWGNPILALEAKMSAREAMETARRFLTDAPIASELTAQLPERVDDDAVLHLRLDKQAAATETLVLVGPGAPDPIYVRLKVATYPARKDLALEALHELAGAELRPD